MGRNLKIPGFAITFALGTASVLGAIVAPMLIDRKRVDRKRNIAYGPGEAQKLDVYLPRERPAGEKLPISLLIHGGGFRYFSKDSHAAAAARLAESGRIVFCIDYRLIPKHPFPAGLFDTAVAYAWMVEHAAEYGGDLERISLVGESSGAGFVLSLCLYLFGISKFPPEVVLPNPPLARPKACIAHCGYYEVSNIARFEGDPRCHSVARTRVAQIRSRYLPNFDRGSPSEWALADPATALAAMTTGSARVPPDFPEFFVPVGERDPVIGDSERLARTLGKLGQRERLKVYPGAGHAFYAAPSGAQAKACWKDIVAFLDRSHA